VRSTGQVHTQSAVLTKYEMSAFVALGTWTMSADSFHTLQSAMSVSLGK